MQLFCFTHAGGTASFFNVIEKKTNYELVKLEYAGHGTRYDEPLQSSIAEISDDMYIRLFNLYNGGDYALFGYSMGVIVLVEVLRRLIEGGNTLPKRVFLAAHGPQKKKELIAYKCHDTDDYIKQTTIHFGGIPQILVNNKSFWRLYLPLYKNDYAAIDKYDFENINLNTSVPATIFYSQRDTSLGELLSWKHYFIGECLYYKFEGSHFFINDHYEEIAKIVNNSLVGE